jgi:hypothetical protein
MTHTDARNCQLCQQGSEQALCSAVTVYVVDLEADFEPVRSGTATRSPDAQMNMGGNKLRLVGGHQLAVIVHSAHWTLHAWAAAAAAGRSPSFPAGPTRTSLACCLLDRVCSSSACPVRAGHSIRRHSKEQHSGKTQCGENGAKVKRLRATKREAEDRNPTAPHSSHPPQSPSVPCSPSPP